MQRGIYPYVYNRRHSTTRITHERYKSSNE